MSELSNFTGRCIDRESIDEYVMHEVTAESDGVKYVLNVVAQDPMHAIEVARFVKQDEGWRVEQ
jgi:hypothetical protein